VIFLRNCDGFEEPGQQYGFGRVSNAAAFYERAVKKNIFPAAVPPDILDFAARVVVTPGAPQLLIVLEELSAV
jgi:hypothetical protein